VRRGVFRSLGCVGVVGTGGAWWKRACGGCYNVETGALRLDARRSPLGGCEPDMLGMLIWVLRFEREGRSERERRVEGFLGGRRGREDRSWM